MALELQRILNNSYASPFNSLTNLVDLASTAGEMYLVAPEDIKSEVYVFDTRGEESASLESDITDNWVEDNTTMQDHIGLKPMTITLRGYVGELTNKVDPDLQQIEEKYRNLSPKLPNLSISALNPFLPQLTTQAQYIVNRAEEVYGIYKKANRTIDRLEDRMAGVVEPDVSNQQKVWGRFYDIWKKRSLVTVYTPFGAYNSMAILSLNARQEEDSAYISEFSVTFKEIRIAKKISTYSDPEKEKSAKAAMTMAKQQDKGVKKPSDNTSWFKHAVNVGPAQAVKDLMSGRVP